MLTTPSLIDPSDTAESPVGKPFLIRSQRRVRLGPLEVDIRSNEPRFEGMRYFPKSAEITSESLCDYTLSLCNLTVDAPWPLERLHPMYDRTYRGKRFVGGYYLTDHYGAPAYLMTHGTHYWVFANDFRPILWPCLAKWLLTRYSIDHGMLHLKAASLAVDDAGILLVAHGEGGKTVLLTQLCRRGARFLSNTHTLVHDRRIIAVPNAMRIRNDVLFGPLIASRSLPNGPRPGEYFADPYADLGWRGDEVAPLKIICLVDFRKPGTQTVQDIDRETLFNYMDQFALAVNVYGLKEDVLDHFTGEVTAFSQCMQEMRERLRAIVTTCDAYYVSCDAMVPETLEALYQILGKPHQRHGSRTPPHP